MVQLPLDGSKRLQAPGHSDPRHLMESLSPPLPLLLIHWGNLVVPSYFHPAQLLHDLPGAEYEGAGNAQGVVHGAQHAEDASLGQGFCHLLYLESQLVSLHTPIHSQGSILERGVQHAFLHFLGLVLQGDVLQDALAVKGPFGEVDAPFGHEPLELLAQLDRFLIGRDLTSGNHLRRNYKVQRPWLHELSWAWSSTILCWAYVQQLGDKVPPKRWTIIRYFTGSSSKFPPGHHRNRNTSWSWRTTLTWWNIASMSAMIATGWSLNRNNTPISLFV